MAPERRCAHEYDDGSPCQAPSSFVDPETGYCPSHGPGASERLSEIGRKGGEAKARKDRRQGLEEDALPELDSPQAAEKLLEVVARAVATGALGHNEAKAVARLVREWLRAREAGEVEDRVTDLERKLAAARRGDLELVEGDLD